MIIEIKGINYKCKPFSGDGYFEKPINKIHPALSKIKTIIIKDLIERSIKE